MQYKIIFDRDSLSLKALLFDDQGKELDVPLVYEVNDATTRSDVDVLITRAKTRLRELRDIKRAEDADALARAALITKAQSLPGIDKLTIVRDADLDVL